jgi:hypothetical protein
MLGPPLRKQVEEVAEGFNPDWLLPPKEGELIKSLDECFQRLQAWAFIHGFTIVTTTSDIKKARFLTR